MTDLWSLKALTMVDWSQTTRRISQRRSVAVVVPVFNGGAVVEACLDALLRNTTGARLIVIDDCSTDPYTLRVLEGLRRDGRVEVHRHTENWGYTRSANHAIQIAGDSDVVLLNSDAVVGSNWLPWLTLVAYSSDNVGTVSAVSDNAGAMSVPEAGRANIWPRHLTWDEISRLVAERVTSFSQQVPTGHGFCMFIKQSLLERIGNFDEIAFPRGYGEENEFSRRAVEAGFVNLLAPQVLVHHERGVTFGDERAGLIDAGVAEVVARYPDYREKVRQWMSSAESSELRSELGRVFDLAWSRQEVKKRVLYVLHKAGGGTPQTNMDLMLGLSEYQEGYLLEAVGGHSIVLNQLVDGELVRIRTWRPAQPFHLTDTWREDYATFLVETVMSLNIELVHVRHLINQPLTTLPDVLHMLHVPMVLSTHDFYYVCPTVHLIDDRGKFCGGSCTAGDGVCDLPTAFVRGAPANLKHEWIKTWRERAAHVFGLAASVIATTQSAARLHADIFPGLEDRIAIIEHGRDLLIAPIRKTRKPGPPRVLAAAQWAPHKGEAYLRVLANGVRREVEWHILGTRGSNLGDFGIVHGAYKRDDFGDLAKDIDPDLVAVMATWPETYSHTLTEAWSLGIPVMANDIGAVADRIRMHGGGVILPTEAGSEAVHVFRGLIDQGLDSIDLPKASGIRSVTTMAEDYRTVVYSKRGLQPATSVGMISARLSHPRAGCDVAAREADRLGLGSFRSIVVADLLSGADLTDYAVIVVNGDVLSAEESDLLLALRDARGFDVVVQVDEDFFSPLSRRSLGTPDGGPSDRDPAIDKLVKHADRVIVSTERLRGVVGEITDISRVAVSAGRLDPRLWESRVPASSSISMGLPVYLAGSDHAASLELLLGVPEILSEMLKRRVIIEVAGGGQGAVPQGMKRFEVSASSYPEFVYKLRQVSHRWSVGLAPLASADIEPSTSDVRLLEYASLGLPCVASRRGPYGDVADLGHLVDDDPSSWAEAVLPLMRDSGLAARSVSMAQAAAAGRFYDAAEVGAWWSLVARQGSER